jgi:hypothetical protein
MLSSIWSRLFGHHAVGSSLTTYPVALNTEPRPMKEATPEVASFVFDLDPPLSHVMTL